jgi:hypothetical protein
MNQSTIEAMVRAVKELFSTFYLEDLTDDELASMLSLLARIKVRMEKPVPGQKPQLKAVGTE